ncbi:hypoxia inducible factor 1 subunit alpha, like isoform X2 [Notolabrus celidotus]|uniref:hypoxia inducible factor 1 subunit alpha, like isoform X2 n=1 Tax=Notolabrus celidotus TaxID=1203425 RepID=UPI00148FB82C|nr:hypoxia inducible factor 1 subunit alpha, like isoform X2 [Notolabrus celidotus]
MEEREKSVPVKRTSSEQRKLRSRDAARCRRSKETEVFYELARTLPLPRRVSTHLDKAAIMRVALSFLSLHRLLRPGEDKKMESVEEEEEEEDPMDTFYPQVLAGFIMVMSEEGDMIYLTENVDKHIGITQLELLGQSVYDFVHPCDQEELRDLLAPRPGLSKKPLAEQSSERNFFLRMKSTLTSRGRTVNIKSADWKVLHCTGHMRPFSCSSTSPPSARVMTLLCEPVPHPSSVEFLLDTHTFLTRHSMDLRFTHCEGRVMELVGYKPDDLIGCSAYEFHHALDSDHVNKSLHTLLSKGQVSTSCYRFLVNGGGFVWAQTQATVLYNSKTSQPEAVVCLNFILSAVEQPDVVFSVEQTRSSRLSEAEAHTPPLSPQDVETSDISDSDSERLPEVSGSNPTSDVDLFSKLREEPEALLQLAPAVGDAIIPLTGDFVELSFCNPSGPDSVPEHPQDLCTPQLRQLLSPIFNYITPPSSSSSPASSSSAASSPQPQRSSREVEGMEISVVGKFFAVHSEDKQKTEEVKEEMDLEMLAPYISMDDDFQLTVVSSSLSEEAAKPSSPSSSERTAVTPSGSGRRKRTHDADEEMPSELMIQGKRQKQEPSSIEEELLLSHRLLDCLEETDQSDLVLQAGSGGRSQLLTDRDPLLGGIQGLCDTAALMRDIFSPRPPDPSPSLLLMT